MNFIEPGIITLYAALQAIFCAFVALLIALPTAYFLWRYSFPGQRWCNALLYVCSVMPTKAAALAVNLCYGMHGFIGIGIGLFLINLPFAILLMQHAYGSIDRLSLLVAAGLGATPWRCYRDIIWPQIYAAVVAAVGVIFVLCFCAVSFTPVLGNQWYHATPDSMMQQAYQAGNGMQIVVYGILRLFIISAIGYCAMRGKQSSCVTHIPMKHTRKRYTIRQNPWWAIVLGGVILCISAPLVMLMRHGVWVGMLGYLYDVITGQPDAYIGFPAWHTLYYSIGIACISGAGAVLMSGLLCWARTLAPDRSGGVQVLVLLPYVVGGVGCGILFDQLAHAAILTPLVAMILSHMLLNYPLAYQLLYAQSASYDPEWTYCARSLGARMRSVYRTLYLPYILPALINAWCLSMSLSLTEVGAASVVSGNAFMTLPMALRIYRAAGYEAGTLGMVCIIGFLAFVCALGSSYFKRRFPCY